MIGKNNFELFSVSRVRPCGKTLGEMFTAAAEKLGTQLAIPSHKGKAEDSSTLPIARPKLPDKAVFVKFANERAVDEAGRIYVNESWILQLH